MASLGVHVNEGYFVLWYIFWRPPSAHNEFVHIGGGKWTEICLYIRFCPHFVGCPCKSMSTWGKFYCMTNILPNFPSVNCNALAPGSYCFIRVLLESEYVFEWSFACEGCHVSNTSAHKFTIHPSQTILKSYLFCFRLQFRFLCYQLIYLCRII